VLGCTVCDFVRGKATLFFAPFMWCAFFSLIQLWNDCHSVELVRVLSKCGQSAMSTDQIVGTVVLALRRAMLSLAVRRIYVW